MIESLRFYPIDQGTTRGLRNISEANADASGSILPHHFSGKPDYRFLSRQTELEIDLAALRQAALGLNCQSVLAQIEQRGRHILRVGVGDGGLRVQATP